MNYKSINVAYDITILGNCFSHTDPKTGIYRMTEELMLELVQHSDVELTLIGLCGDNPVTNSISCYLYYEKHTKFECKFAKSFESRLGIEWLYQNVFKTYFSKDFQKKPKLALQSIYLRSFLKLVQYSNLIGYDVSQIIKPENYSIFHSPYFKLPSEEITGSLPRLLTVHDLIPITAKQFVDSSLTNYFKHILNSINYHKDWITCNSEYTKQEFCDYTKISPERVFVTYLAASNQFFPIPDLNYINNTRTYYKIPEENYFLCLASQLEPRKNILHLINCFVRLISEQPTLDVNLVLIGTKRYAYNELNIINKNCARFTNRIIFTGYVSDDNLSALYSGAISFIFPSLYEGFGLPILEAMQCGVPVIASNTTSIPEVAGDAAILVDPKDEDALCQAMFNILNDATLRTKLSQRGLERARQFSWSRCAAETVEVYKKVVDNS